MKLTTTEAPLIRYKDLTFRLIVCLIGAHIIMLTGEDISTFEAFTIKSYYPVLAINYGIALILAWIVKRITINLDRRYSWESNLWLRALLQVTLGLALVSVIAFFLVFIYFRSFGQSIMESNYPRYQFPLVVALLALLNAFYIIYYFYHRLRHLSETDHATGKRFKEYINVLEGSHTISLAASDIAYIHLVGKGVLVRTWEKKDFLCDYTLDELEEILDPDQFFRINRRVIAHRAACKSYEPLEYGKLRLTLIPVTLEDATISQRKATAFKEWKK